MTTNQKIAIGCGGGGCLLLIVVAIFAAVGYFYYQRNAVNYNDNRNANYNFNRSSNRNSNAANSAPSTSTSDDDRHKLYQAAAATYERDLIKRVNEKIGLLDADGVPRQKYAQFTRDHIAWIFRNTDWINQECNAREK